MPQLPSSFNSFASSESALGGWGEHITAPPVLPADSRELRQAGRDSSSIAALLGTPPLPFDGEQNAGLLKARLGVAAGLFTALRHKHAETAAHSIRVAITCSIWAAEKQFTAEEREALEIAALLHDIGK